MVEPLGAKCIVFNFTKNFFFDSHDIGNAFIEVFSFKVFRSVL
jgi:hypothetical protein